MDKKISKKMNRSVGLLRSHEPGVTVSSTPTKVLYVGNGGILCGWNRERLYNLFCRFGDRPCIQIIQHKPYSFVSFPNVDASSCALTALQGTDLANFGISAAKLYLAYVDQVPKLGKRENTLDKDGGLPVGLVLLPGFIEGSQESELIETIRQYANQDIVDQANSHPNGLKNRQVLHFGFRFVYGSNNVDLEHPGPSIPAEFRQLIDRIMETGHVLARPDQITINIYEPGQGIPLHTDTHSAFEDAIISLSLGSDVLFDFQHAGDVDHQILPVLVARRSLMIMTNEARYVWKHGITPRKTDSLPDGSVVERAKRVSLTFRAVRRMPCDCRFARYCDWDRGKTTDDDNVSIAKTFPKNNAQASELERECVADVYEAIADHFDVTRYSLWPGVQRFLDSFSSCSVVLDVGCGNGKYLGRKDNLVKIGCDRSLKLCDISVGKGCSVFCADCLSLPIASCRFDGVISVAVIHHLSTMERRKKSVEAMLKCLRPYGRALIYVWAFEQKWKQEKSAYLKTDNYTPVKLASNREDAGDDGDLRLVSKSANCIDIAVKVKIKEPELKAIDLSRDPTAPVVIAGLNPSEDSSSGNVNINHTAVLDDNGDRMAGDGDGSVLTIHKNRTNFVEQDVLVPWTKQKQSNSSGDEATFYRFYHVFKYGELEELCATIDGCEIVESYHEQGNWCIVLRKL